MSAPRHRITGVALGLASMLCLALFAGTPTAGAEWYELGGEPVAVTLLDSSPERTLLEVTVGGFSAEPVTIDGRTYYRIALDEESKSLERGLPALPDVRRSIVIPDDREMAARLVDADYVEFPEMPVAPSKGPISRAVDPATVPYAFDAFYAGSGTYPRAPVSTEAPYILRDLRGMVVDANVFQYNAATQTLRVYTRMQIEVSPVGPGRLNVLERQQPLQKMDPQFAQIYRERFINFKGERYTPVLEDGGLLIITYDAFRPHVEPLYEWKLQKGIATKLVDLTEVGSTSTEIKNYIQNEYDTWDLAYVLLVGDAAQVPTMSYGNGSDPSYSLVAGTDDYPDIFIGRFSAETTGEVDTQVERTIAYERDTAAGLGWPQSGIGVASDEGPGDDGEYDDEHADNIRLDLLGYGYDAVDQIYAPTATRQMITDALNAGRGIGNYTGHGSTYSWITTGFSTSDIDALTNTYMLPFICSVACVNGNFTSTTCFAEAWLRATHNGLPSGAVACYMSTINQDWYPPMAMQDEAVDLLVADEMRTIGGLWFNGSCLMMDEYSTSGVNEFKCWTIFGDPSLSVRTKAAETLVVNHVGTLLLGESTYAVDVTGEEGALVALYADGTLYGRALTDASGAATIALDPVPAEPMNLTLTVTAYNHETYQGSVEVVPASGPYLLVDDSVYYDGNEDDILNAGEAVDLSLELRNAGSADAAGVWASISTASEFVDVVVDSQYFGNIPAGEREWSHGSFSFEIAADCPDQHLVTLAVDIQGTERLSWESQLSFTVQAPTVSVAGIWVDDAAGGDGNSRLDPGESADLVLTLGNAGHYGLSNATAELVCSDPLVTVTAASGALAELGAGATGDLAPPFGVSVDPAFDRNEAYLLLYLSGDNGFTELFHLPLAIGGFFATFEAGDEGWSHDVVLPGFTDQWHLSTARNHSPGGGQCWKCGDTGTGDYASLLDAGLISTPVPLSDYGELRFWHWIDTEISGSYQGKAYDGGLVEISLDGGPFEQITPEGGYPYTIRPGSTPGPFPENTPVFAGEAVGWEMVSFDLTGMSGNAVFRFRFGTDGAVTAEGWYVDDVEVIEGSDPSAARELELLPAQVYLARSQPNPFTRATQIRFALPQEGQARLQVFDANGRLVRTLFDGTAAGGHHGYDWNGRYDSGQPAASGIYYYRLVTTEGSRQKSMVLLR